MFDKKVPKHGVFEQRFRLTTSYENPYKDVCAIATLTPPHGVIRKIPLFWESDQQWMMRFSPDMTGNWHFVIESFEEELNGSSGEFACVESRLKGGIKPMERFPYHFQYEDGTPLWFFGDTQWRAFADDQQCKLDRQTLFDYIDLRAQQGFNYIHTDVMGGGGIDGQQNVFLDYGEEMVNLDFFREMDLRVQYMNSKGITSGIVLAWHKGPEAWDAFTSEAAWLRYARYITARYSAYNVVFIVSGEWDQIKTERKTMFNRVGMEIMENDPHKRLRAIHPCQKRTVEEFAEEPWMSFGDYQQMYQASHGREATPRERLALYTALVKTRVHNKPVINSEYAYYLREMAGNQDYKENIAGVDKPHSHTRDSFRRASWVLAMAGGYFVTGFGTVYFGGWRDKGKVFDPRAEKNKEAEQDLTQLRNFFAELDWWKLNPDNTLICADHEGVAYCLVDPGKTYIVYAEGTEQIKVDISATEGAPMQVQIYDPREGLYTDIAGQLVDGVLHLSAPDKQDWGFVIQCAPKSS